MAGYLKGNDPIGDTPIFHWTMMGGRGFFHPKLPHPKFLRNGFNTLGRLEHENENASVTHRAQTKSTEITIGLQVTLGFSQSVVLKKPNFCQYTVRTLDVQILTLNVKNMVQNDCPFNVQWESRGSMWKISVVFPGKSKGETFNHLYRLMSTMAHHKPF